MLLTSQLLKKNRKEFHNYIITTTSKKIMASSPLPSSMMMMIIILVLLVRVLKGVCRENFEQDFKITWGNDKGKILNNGELLTLSLDSYSGSGFESSKEYLFGRIDMQIKLVLGNSAGTVTAYYLSSKDDRHDEIDYEFLGNLTGEPYTVHTNIYVYGKGEKEQQFHLWFDPAADFHTYSIIWNPQIIIFAIDETPIRQFKNRESNGIPFPKSQAMRLYSSIWNADQWATQGGRVKTDWNQAPFSSTYRNFKANACTRIAGRMSCGPQTSAWMTLRELKGKSLNRLKWVRKNYMIYNYCTDTKRFPQGLPKECNVLE